MRLISTAIIVAAALLTVACSDSNPRNGADTGVAVDGGCAACGHDAALGDAAGTPDTGQPHGDGGGDEISGDTGAADAGMDIGFDAGVDAGWPDVSFACVTPAGAYPDGGWFVDKSVEYNLKEKVSGIRMMSVDLDNDYYPDLIIHKVTGNEREDRAAAPPRVYRYVLLNRIKDGQGFLDYTLDSKYGQRRDDPAKLDRVEHLTVAADVNNDGNLDLFSGTYTNLDPAANPQDLGDRSEILIGDGKGVFTLGPESDIFRTDPGTVTSATFLDYDRDGNVDLFVGRWYQIYGSLASQTSQLFKGDGKGGFVDVTDSMGMTTDFDYEKGTSAKPTYGVTACDVDGDGNTDFITSSYGREWNFLWWRNGDKFQEIGKETTVAGDDNTNYSDDNYYRCYCQTNPGKCNPQPAAPDISCASGGWSWIPGIDDRPWRLNGNTFTTVCADIDNDLRPDLLHAEIHHWHIGQSSDRSQILKNVATDNPYGFAFVRQDNRRNGMARTWPKYNWNEGDISGAVFDFDNDGLPDILIASSDYPDTRVYLWRQKPNGSFEEVAEIAGVAHYRGQEVTVADFNRDGSLDIVVGTSLARWDSTDPVGPPPPEPYVYLYENTLGKANNSVEFRLVGGGAGKANKAAIGARITITTKSGRQMREVQGGYGHFGLQNDLVQHFGLGADCMIDEVEVRWPDKDLTVQKFKDVAPNWLIEIEQGAASVKYVMPFSKR